MILDCLTNADQYVSLNQHFTSAFSFLRRLDLLTMPPGKYELKSSLLIAIVVDGENVGEEKAELESHQKYIDIHYTLAGVDRIGWKSVSNSTVSKAYNSGNDTTFYGDRPQAWCDLFPKHFAIFFPGDAHATMAGEGRVKKVVIKVAINSDLK